ncbi:MAG: helicase with metal-binding cysteine cluster [Synechococcus sp. SB0666_bin_14]|nr:helicase with metal-binding cysteine cluster [Synechococcus sp. SB0666_bin_14]MYA90469.1 helicase with metal-binding cysteine cluster [Synechococcus sp. SB0663_bin_10]MYG45900.1 helicase with metal-binding cysteine cluster [Synechococcus sp. SB0675_bin_6]MYJ59517.1 helicase with metal-binding cysteine cluster [Synechococcus sp. SB0672_bin_6]MYK91819.1 helicase with metal-binding cysteine cluster [Synechococcus sp. SB0669_bin_8]
MLPSVVTSEMEQVAADAVRTAFHPTTPGFRGLIERFLGERERLLKGPYVSVALPFREGSGRNWFPEIPLPFSPYLHQEKAFKRLLSGSPRNTLVATGTGSGKTECFCCRCWSTAASTMARAAKASRRFSSTR